MNEYRGKHTPSVAPWPVSSHASSRYRSRHAVRNRRRRRWAVFAAVLFGLALIYPFAEARMLRVDRVNLSSEDLPADIGHLRIVYLSDVHYGFFYSEGQAASLVTAINSLKPDIVLFGGDMGDSPEAAVSFYKSLPSIHARYEILGVLGDADRGGDDLQRARVTDAMREAGVTPLVNTVVPVRVGTSEVYVAGLDDSLTGAPDLAGIAGKAAAENYVIFLAHNPSVIPDAQRTVDRNGRLGWFDLALFGHTHGGQIAGLGSLINIAADVDDRYRGGWLVENRCDLLISEGVGCSVLPARLFCPPVIHCIDIAST